VRRRLAPRRVIYSGLPPGGGDQVAATYRRPVAEMLLTMPLAWRGLHRQGPALLSLMVKHLGDDIDAYSLREAEFGCNTIVGFNFGDGHFHDEQVDAIDAVVATVAVEPPPAAAGAV
jgi:Transmembrane protein of unknown function (DUF3556)